MMKLSDRLRDWDADIRTQVEGSPHTETRTVLGDTAALLDECERVLAPLADKWLHPDDIGPEMAAEIRADEDWNEAENDKRADDVWIERGWIRAARATLAKLRGEA